MGSALRMHSSFSSNTVPTTSRARFASLSAKNSASFQGHAGFSKTLKACILRGVSAGDSTPHERCVRRDRGRKSPWSSSRNIRALVQIDLGPSVVLGSSLMVSAIALYQVRASRPEVSRDKDVFFSSIGLLCGGILIFQGWRLDPLILFGQLLTTATAVAFATETISLRQELVDTEMSKDLGRSRPRRRRSNQTRSLPPVDIRDMGSRVDYGARGGYPREELADSYATSARGFETESMNDSSRRRRDDFERWDDVYPADFDDSADSSDVDDQVSPYREGFSGATRDSSQRPPNWDDDDDFV